MRIAFDVSPLSHQATGVGNYIRGTLGGLVGASAGAHEIVAFAPTSLRGPAHLMPHPGLLEGANHHVGPSAPDFLFVFSESDLVPLQPLYLDPLLEL